MSSATQSTVVTAAIRVIGRQKHAWRVPGAHRPVLALKPIESVQPRDSVWAWSAQSGRLVKRCVKRMFRHPARRVLRVAVCSETGDTEFVTATIEHPFWVVGSGWIAAGKLRPGDLLKRIEAGPPIRVVEVTVADELAEVFNFEVVDDQNYFIGRSGILVHNRSGFDENDNSESVVSPVAGFFHAQPSQLPSWKRGDIAGRPFKIDSKAVAALNEVGLQNQSAFPSTHYRLDNGQAFVGNRVVGGTLLPAVFQPTDLVEIGKGAFKTCYTVVSQPDLVYLVNQPDKPPGVVLAEIHANQSQQKRGMPVVPMLSFHSANFKPGAIQIGFTTYNLGAGTQPLKYKSLIKAAQHAGLDLSQYLPESSRDFLVKKSARANFPLIEFVLGNASGDDTLMRRVHDGIYQYRHDIASVLGNNGRPLTPQAVRGAVAGLWSVYSAKEASVDTQLFYQRDGTYALGDAAAHIDSTTAPILTKYKTNLDLVPIELETQMRFNKGFAIGLEISSSPPMSQVPDRIQ